MSFTLWLVYAAIYLSMLKTPLQPHWRVLAFARYQVAPKPQKPLCGAYRAFKRVVLGMPAVVIARQRL